jgi:TRAP-type C4-dicarboxylate transport system permease small subunit
VTAVRALDTALKRLLAVVTAITRIFLVLLMVEILVLTAGQAVDRYLLHTTFDAYEQLASVGVVWVTFFGYALGFHERANLRIELLDTVLPPVVTAIKRVVFDVLILVLALGVNFYGWDVLDVVSTQDIIGTPFTNGIAYWSLQSGTILIAFYAVGHMLHVVLALLLGEPLESPVVL